MSFTPLDVAVGTAVTAGVATGTLVGADVDVEALVTAGLVLAEVGLAGTSVAIGALAVAGAMGEVAEAAALVPALTAARSVPVAAAGVDGACARLPAAEPQAASASTAAKFTPVLIKVLRS